ncbi:MAG: hypothetical protein GXY65_16405 [Rhodococcus sp.]|uniref:hypothetical protein n=1 Tax=Rhodococcus sp. TaxID=1831 RepID=UPI0016951C4E|nr:hypothetical protein [Rhodococcus sp. (in: high G+C Gram-positive bacteria)]NLV80887.1 hypothetical protein [Rhodococcus sp. (in: high G+C Gram-positive bacteria)]
MSATRPLPEGTPPDVVARAAHPPRVPEFDPALGIDVHVERRATPRHRLVAIGDSLLQGFQSGAVFHTDLSVPAIVAYELGVLPTFRYPRFGGPGGLPLNVEVLLRRLEDRYGAHPRPWQIPAALFTARGFMDEVEDYWERGPGAEPPVVGGYNHNLSCYGWDLRDALGKTAAICAAALETPVDNLLDQIVQNNGDRAALHVYPHWAPPQTAMTLFDAATALGDDRDDDADAGIETLVVFLGSNNALRSVTELKVEWSGPDFRDPDAKNAYTVWRPEHFDVEYAEVVGAVRAVSARHVVLCTVPHVTIAPIARGIGDKSGTRYFPYYTRPWVDERRFDAVRDEHITGAQARAVDIAIDHYNETITAAVADARRDGLDWYLLDTAGLLERLASRRYIHDVNARPDWWEPYPLPPELAALQPVPDTRFLTADGDGGRRTGGLFSLDGVHPTTVGYGILARELVRIMAAAGVEFRGPNGAVRADPSVDFERLVRLDTLVRTPPQNIDSTLSVLGWADEALDVFRRILHFGV